MIARVRSVSAASILRVSRFPVSRSTSMKTGCAPVWEMAKAVAEKVCETVMTSSPSPTP